MGHAIGNVFNKNILYTAVGSYRNEWDFAARRGSVEMGFDGTDYTGQTRPSGDGVRFSGSLNPSDSTPRAGSLHGSFVAPATDAIGAPAGQVGGFSIQETKGDIYRASGTFAAEQK